MVMVLVNCPATAPEPRYLSSRSADSTESDPGLNQVDRDRHPGRW